jgi:hypothetical protein
VLPSPVAGLASAADVVDVRRGVLPAVNDGQSCLDDVSVLRGIRSVSSDAPDVVASADLQIDRNLKVTFKEEQDISMKKEVESESEHGAHESLGLGVANTVDINVGVPLIAVAAVNAAAAAMMQCPVALCPGPLRRDASLAGMGNGAGVGATSVWGRDQIGRCNIGGVVTSTWVKSGTNMKTEIKMESPTPAAMKCKIKSEQALHRPTLQGRQRRRLVLVKTEPSGAIVPVAPHFANVKSETNLLHEITAAAKVGPTSGHGAQGLLPLGAASEDATNLSVAVIAAAPLHPAVAVVGPFPAELHGGHASHDLLAAGNEAGSGVDAAPISSDVPTDGFSFGDAGKVAWLKSATNTNTKMKIEHSVTAAVKTEPISRQVARGKLPLRVSSLGAIHKLDSLIAAASGSASADAVGQLPVMLRSGHMGRVVLPAGKDTHPGVGASCVFPETRINAADVWDVDAATCVKIGANVKME